MFSKIYTQQTYGVDHILTLQNLARLSLFKPSDPAIKNPYSQICRNLKVIVDDVDEQKPNDISYVYSGYAPISVRIVQSAFQTVSASPPAPLRAVMGAVASPATKTPSLLMSGAMSASASFKAMEDVLKIIPGGPAFEINQKTEEPDILLKRKFVYYLFF